MTQSEIYKAIKGEYAFIHCIEQYVYAGKIDDIKSCPETGDWMLIKETINLRWWGTNNGIGELAIKGPLETTKIDPVSTTGITAYPLSSVVSVQIIDKGAFKRLAAATSIKV